MYVSILPVAFPGLCHLNLIARAQRKLNLGSPTIRAFHLPWPLRYNRRCNDLLELGGVVWLGNPFHSAHAGIKLRTCRTTDLYGG